MSKILIHIGPPKTGTTQLQAFLHSNSEALHKKSIAYRYWKLKENIRSYYRAYQKIKRGHSLNHNTLKPWYLNHPNFNKKLHYVILSPLMATKDAH